eukprot:gene21851-28285_t
MYLQVIFLVALVLFLECGEAFLIKRLLPTKQIGSSLRCESSDIVDLIQGLRREILADKAERQLEREADKAERQLEREGTNHFGKKRPLTMSSLSAHIMNRRKINDVEAYKCQSVQQLAGICLPTGYEFKEQNVTKISGIRSRAQIGMRATNLARVALKQISQTSTSSISSPKSDEAKVQYLRDDRLGFFTYTSAILTNQELEGFVEDLEIDFRLVVLQAISLFVGEIKSGSGGGTFNTSLRQLLRRLGVLYMAGLHSLGDLAPNYSFVGVGEIISPNDDWMDPDAELIDKIKNEAGIVGYPAALQISVGWR